MTEVERPRSHGPSRHVEGCQCVRCTGFPEGNTLALKHGLYCRPKLAARAAELADQLRELVPGASAADEIAVSSLAVVVARIEAVSVALAQLDGDDPSAQYLDDRGERLRLDASRWLRLGLDFATALGLTPAARAKLGVDVARLHREAFDLARLDDSEVRALRALVAKAEGEP